MMTIAPTATAKARLATGLPAPNHATNTPCSPDRKSPGNHSIQVMMMMMMSSLATGGMVVVAIASRKCGSHQP